jgi:hypothetical protein
MPDDFAAHAQPIADNLGVAEVRGGIAWTGRPTGRTSTSRQTKAATFMTNTTGFTIGSEVACSGNGGSWTRPVVSFGPPRMGLVPFAELKCGPGNCLGVLGEFRMPSPSSGRCRGPRKIWLWR